MAPLTNATPDIPDEVRQRRQQLAARSAAATYCHGIRSVSLSGRCGDLVHLADALPSGRPFALLESVRAYTALTDPSGARAVLRQANDIFNKRPDLGDLPPQVEELRAYLETMQAESRHPRAPSPSSGSQRPRSGM